MVFYFKRNRPYLTIEMWPMYLNFVVTGPVTDDFGHFNVIFNIIT